MEENNKDLEEKVDDLGRIDKEFRAEIGAKFYDFMREYIVGNKKECFHAAAAAYFLEKQGEHDAARAVTYAVARKFLAHSGIDSRILDKFDPGYTRPQKPTQQNLNDELLPAYGKDDKIESPDNYAHIPYHKKPQQ